MNELSELQQALADRDHAREERDAMQRRAESAEADWQAVEADLLSAREELATLKALIPKWRATGAQIDTYHATMGAGYKACADELEKALR